MSKLRKLSYLITGADNIRILKGVISLCLDKPAAVVKANSEFIVLVKNPIHYFVEGGSPAYISNTKKIKREIIEEIFGCSLLLEKDKDYWEIEIPNNLLDLPFLTKNFLYVGNIYLVKNNTYGTNKNA